MIAVGRPGREWCVLTWIRVHLIQKSPASKQGSLLHVSSPDHFSTVQFIRQILQNVEEPQSILNKQCLRESSGTFISAGEARVHFQAPHLTHIFFVDGRVCVEEELEFTLFLLCPRAGTKASLGSNVWILFYAKTEFVDLVTTNLLQTSKMLCWPHGGYSFETLGEFYGLEPWWSEVRQALLMCLSISCPRSLRTGFLTSSVRTGSRRGKDGKLAALQTPQGSVPRGW